MFNKYLKITALKLDGYHFKASSKKYETGDINMSNKRLSGLKIVAFYNIVKYYISVYNF